MAEWVSDDMYIKIEGGDLVAPVEVQARWKKVKLGGTVGSIETTRGAKKKHKQFKPGMHEYPLEMTLGINEESIYPDELKLDKIYTITVCPNGNVVGQPMHQQKYFIEDIPLEIETGRGERVYTVKMKQEDGPIVNFFENGKVT
jgi:hypothetical protein